MNYTKNELNEDAVGFIQTMSLKVLAAVARGELDLNKLALEELAERGLDQNGVWVGFDNAAKILTSCEVVK